MKALAGLVGFALLVSCGGDSSDPCPTGSCLPQANTVVKWTLDRYPEVGFDGDSCVDFGIGKMHVELVDEMGVSHATEESCDFGQVTFQGLPEGTYTVLVTPLDGGGGSIVTSAVSSAVMAATVGNNTEVTVNVPWAEWTGTYTGTMLFRIGWDGTSCATTSPPIKKQVLTLTIRGQVVTQSTDNGQKLDGTDPEPCRDLTEEFPQYALMVPFGPGTLLVVGQSASGAPLISHQFDVFSGAGISNPTITYTVPGDAGVDAVPGDAAADAIAGD